MTSTDVGVSSTAGVGASPLPMLPLDSLEFSADPDRFVTVARRQHPWLGRFAQGYVVFGYQAVCDLLADDESLIPGFAGLPDFYDARGAMWARFMDEMLLSLSGPTHARLRASVVHAFTMDETELRFLLLVPWGWLRYLEEYLTLTITFFQTEGGTARNATCSVSSSQRTATHWLPHDRAVIRLPNSSPRCACFSYIELRQPQDTRQQRLMRFFNL
jgi:hypothetical protein